MNCPICISNIKETGITNRILHLENYYCNNCHSYHVIEKINDAEFYKEQYHTSFKYKTIGSSIFAKVGLVSNRCNARFNYIKKNIKLNRSLNVLEIGGGSGDNFVAFNVKSKLQKFTIIEPDAKFNIQHNKLQYFNSLFEDVDTDLLKNNEIVLMFHVLEHVFDLKAFFTHLKLISPKFFYFEVPNIDNEIVLEDSLNNHPHYHHFSSKSIDYLLKENGFTKVSLDCVMPQSYHPYKKVSFIERYTRRLIGLNETFNPNGIYLRGIYELKNE
jgi:Methyltransferase domain